MGLLNSDKRTQLMLTPADKRSPCVSEKPVDPTAVLNQGPAVLSGVEGY